MSPIYKTTPAFYVRKHLSEGTYSVRFEDDTHMGPYDTMAECLTALNARISMLLNMGIVPSQESERT